MGQATYAIRPDPFIIGAAVPDGADHAPQPRPVIKFGTARFQLDKTGYAAHAIAPGK
jgi:hypothetical protein